MSFLGQTFFSHIYIKCVNHSCILKTRENSDHFTLGIKIAILMARHVKSNLAFFQALRLHEEKTGYKPTAVAQTWDEHVACMKARNGVTGNNT